jgi:hypothetical protein
VAAESLTTRIVSLLDSDRVEMRCAAAMVLGAAGCGDAKIGKALAGKLGDVAPVQRAALDGLIALEATGLAKQLTPLLGSSDELVRQKALQLLADQGAPAEAALRHELTRGTVASRAAVASILVKRCTAPALDALFDQLADGDIGEHTLQMLRAEIDDRESKQRGTILRRALGAIQKMGARVSQRNLPETDPELLRLAALLRLVGYGAEPTSLAVLLRYAAAKQPLPVRLAAIAAMRRIVAQPKATGTDAAVQTLIGFADDREATLARAAVDTLRGAVIPPRLNKKFAALTRAKNPEAQRLAMERMATAGGGTRVDDLIDNLDAVDATAREAASRALAKAPEAAGPLCKALIRAKDARTAWQLARALASHTGQVDAADVKTLVKRTRERLGEDDRDRVAHTQLDALARLAPDAHAELLFEQAEKLRRKKKFGDAFAVLRPLAHSGATLTAEQRFVVAVLGLKATGNDMIRRARDSDPMLNQLSSLLASGFPVAQSLIKLRDLDLEDLHALGFHFIESVEDDAKELGAELLQAVLAKQPRGKLATACRNKLKLAGAA